MTDTEFYTLAAECTLTGMDTDDNFIEHHGIKGQKHGVRRYQNDDGSLTTLGRQHYGIGLRNWIKSRFNPAEKGYRAAVKQKQQQQKIAVQKAKYAGNLKKMLKNKKYFTDEEIERQIDTDTRLQQKVNRLKELSRADKLQRKAEKQADQERADARKEAKFQQKMQKEAMKSQERQHKLERETMLELQKQKDTAQAQREQAQREYQTQQQIAKGKTLLGRIQKLASYSSAISTIAKNGKTLADAIGIDTSGFVDDWKPKKEETKSKQEASESKEKPKEKQKIEKVTADTSKWNANTDNKWSVDSGNKESTEKNKYKVDVSKWDVNIKNEWGKTIIPDTKPTYELKKKYSNIITSSELPDKRTAKPGEKYYSSEQKMRLQEAAEDNGAQGFRERGYRLNGVQNRREREAKREAQREAKERAQEIIENARTVKMNSTGPLSDTVKYVTSLGSTKLANMLSGEVPDNMPNKINLGSLMSTKIEQKPTYLEELRANKKIKHEDMDEDEIAGELEDAE